MELLKQRIFTSQIEFQCQCVLFAHEEITQGPQPPPAGRVFFFLQSLLVAAANVSKLFWAQDPGRSNERLRLRERFGMGEDLSIWRSMPNNVEHFDERVDRLWAKDPNRGFVDMNVDGQPLGLNLNQPILRHYHSATRTLTYLDQEFRIDEFAAEANRLLALVPAVENQIRMDLRASREASR